MITFNDFDKHPVIKEEDKISFGGFDGDLFILMIEGQGIPLYGITHGNYVVCDKSAKAAPGDVILVEKKEAPFRELVVMKDKKEKFQAKVVMTGRLLD